MDACASAEVCKSVFVFYKIFDKTRVYMFNIRFFATLPHHNIYFTVMYESIVNSKYVCHQKNCRLDQKVFDVSDIFDKKSAAKLNRCLLWLVALQQHDASRIFSQLHPKE